MLKVGYLFGGLVMLAHIAFFALEAFYWNHPVGHSVFKMDEAQAAATQLLAANQGFYNLMIAVGLFWGLLRKTISLIQFLLVFVIAVGVFGAVTVSWTIFLYQALPALIGFGLITMGAAKQTP